jgi:hypothetical protein
MGSLSLIRRLLEIPPPPEGAAFPAAVAVAVAVPAVGGGGAVGAAVVVRGGGGALGFGVPAVVVVAVVGGPDAAFSPGRSQSPSGSEYPSRASRVDDLPLETRAPPAPAWARDLPLEGLVRVR